jgi:hypothetical protein
MVNTLKHYYLGVLLILCLLLAGCNPPGPAEAITLKLAVFGEREISSSELSKWVHQYNENNPEVIIEMVNYAENSLDPVEALNQIKIEIAAGKGPDIINFNNLSYSPLDASCGILADIYPFMEKDESFNKEDFYFNIINSFSIGENLYILAPSYRIASFTTVNNNFLGLERFNVNKLIDAYNTKEDDAILFPGETKMAVLGMICYKSMENFVDWDKGICQFDSVNFKEIMHFANRFPLHLNFADDHSVMEYFTEGRAILYPASISNVFDTAMLRTLYGETPVYIGYPLDSGNGNMAEIADIAIGISSTSRNKDEAWMFIKSLLESEFQDNIQNGLPLSIISLEKRLAEAMEIEYDLNGDKIVREQIRFEGEVPIDIYMINNEDAEMLKSIIRKVEFNGEIDSTIYSIMLEEADYMFNDDRNADDVANIIQNRASIYVNENK